MVKFSTIALFVLGSAFTAQASDSCSWCQCLFPNTAHCCVMNDIDGNGLDCQEACKKARRFDGTTEDYGLHVGTPCNAGGAWKCASGFTVQDRVPCYRLLSKKE